MAHSLNSSKGGSQHSEKWPKHLISFVRWLFLDLRVAFYLFVCTGGSIANRRVLDVCMISNNQRCCGDSKD